MLTKTPLLHQSLGPRVFLLFLSLSFSLSLSPANSLERRNPSCSLPCPGLQDPRKRAPCAYVKQCKPHGKGFIGFLRKPGSIGLSLFCFLIVDCGPPGSGPLKDLYKWCQNRGLVHVADSDGVTQGHFEVGKY